MSYRFFENKSCEFYPCHKQLDEINCLFCFCPLYNIDCGGNYTLTPNSVKDCSACTVPHKKENYEYIIKKLKQG